jgi:NAD(P)H-dependent FMN reductase
MKTSFSQLESDPMRGRISLLGICTSMKPGPGQSTRSAAREYLRAALDGLAGYERVGWLDLRQYPFPHFDGRAPEQLENENVSRICKTIDNADRLLVSVPCYWGGVSGVFKNFVDCLCGASYDLDDGHPTVFYQKKLALFVIGADERSATQGEIQARSIFQAVGAIVMEQSVVMANPRRMTCSQIEMIKSIRSMGERLK